MARPARSPPPQTPPRPQPNYGWLTPAVGCIEMMQCVVQAVPLASKKAAHVGKSAECAGALLQLPHFDGEVMRQLARKKIKALPGAGAGTRRRGVAAEEGGGGRPGRWRHLAGQGACCRGVCECVASLLTPPTPTALPLQSCSS